MIDRKAFFDGVRARLFHGTLSQRQVDGMTAILDEWDRRPGNDLHHSDDPRHLAYMLATTQWETASTMWPIEEYGHGAGHAYGVPDPVTGQTYYGRGFVQLTWKANYENMAKRTGADLVHHPELALAPKIATQILFDGMRDGSFTGVGLGRYFNATAEDWFNARRIINGTDKAAEIATLGRTYNEILKTATQGKAAA